MVDCVSYLLLYFANVVFANIFLLPLDCDLVFVRQKLKTFMEFGLDLKLVT